MKVMAPAFEGAALTVPAPVPVDVLSQILVVFCQFILPNVVFRVRRTYHLGIFVPTSHCVNGCAMRRG